MRWHEKASVGLLAELVLGSYKVRKYENRIAISRVDGDRLTWEQVQMVKQAVWGDRTCLEVYPPESSVVNLRHTRHLWHSPQLEQIIKAQCIHPEFEFSDGGNA